MDLWINFLSWSEFYLSKSKPKPKPKSKPKSKSKSKFLLYSIFFISYLISIISVICSNLFSSSFIFCIFFLDIHEICELVDSKIDIGGVFNGWVMGFHYKIILIFLHIFIKPL